MASKRIKRRAFLKAAGVSAGAGALLAQNRPTPVRTRPASPFVNARAQTPNVVFILADDLGYGDLGCYGSRLATPNLDRMAAEGVRFTQFYSTSPVCSPSRAALLTGRYQTRVGVPDVLFPSDTTGLAASETTLAQSLQGQGYKTMCIGKWHLGSQPQFLPTRRGFDSYFGLPYSNDMSPLPLLSNTTILEEPANLATLTQRYTEQAVSFIQRSRETPFFLYFPHTSPHLPLSPSDRFKDKSGFGPYGDTVAEIDWSVGEVLRAVRDNGLDPFTIVMFSSDNGPWYQGSPGTLRGRKGETLEGGVREPFLARFPGRIPAGLVSTGVASMLDILPTVSRLCGAPLPGKPLDGVDIWPLLAGDQPAVARDLLLYFDSWNLQCARSGRWKLHVSRDDGPPWMGESRTNLPLPSPELYDLEADPEESYNAAADNPQVVAAIRARMEALLPTFPGQVQTAWRDTMAIAVNDTPAGAYPVRKKVPPDPG